VGKAHLIVHSALCPGVPLTLDGSEVVTATLEDRKAQEEGCPRPHPLLRARWAVHREAPSRSSVDSQRQRSASRTSQRHGGCHAATPGNPISAAPVAAWALADRTHVRDSNARHAVRASKSLILDKRRDPHSSSTTCRDDERH